MAQRCSLQFQQKGKVRKVAVRVALDNKVKTGIHYWIEVLECKDSNVKTVSFHSTLIGILNKHTKEKHVTMTLFDKKVDSPSQKQM